MIRLAKAGSEIDVLNINRSHRNGQFAGGDLELAASLHPHLIRAFRLSQKFAEAQQVKDGMAYALDRSPHGLFLIDESGRVRHANRVGEALVAETGGLRLTGGRLTAATPEAARRLDGLISRAARSDAGRRAGGSMAVPSPLRRTPLSLTVAPLRSERFEFPAPCIWRPSSASPIPRRERACLSRPFATSSA